MVLYRTKTPHLPCTRPLRGLELHVTLCFLIQAAGVALLVNANASRVTMVQGKAVVLP